MTLSPDLNRPCRRQPSNRASSIRCTVFSASGLMGYIQIAEARVGTIPAQADDARLAVAVLGHNALSFVLVGLAVLAVLGVLVGRAVEEQHDIGVLLDRAGVAQVGQLGAVVGAACRFFRRTGQLRQRDNRDVEFLCHDF